jgi:hypothetical protein
MGEQFVCPLCSPAKESVMSYQQALEMQVELKEKEDQMTCAQALKTLGFKDLKSFANLINRHESVVKLWYKNNRDFFWIVAMGARSIHPMECTNDWSQ